MKVKTVRAFPASTLAEVLVVIIVSGLLFLALFDGMDLVKRYSRRLGGMLFPGETLLDNYRRLDYLFYVSDSVQAGDGVYCFYRNGECQTRVEYRDSFLLSVRGEYADTLFREVAEIRSVPAEGYPLLLDSLYVDFIYRGRRQCFSFGLAIRSGRNAEIAVKELEKQYNSNDNGTER